MSGDRPSLDLVIETPLGSVGIVMLPLSAAQVNPGEPSLLPHLLQGLALAAQCGARCVALTGLIPSATGYGAKVEAAWTGRKSATSVTTGHATTIAAVTLNLEALLREAGRDLHEESVLFHGVGSIGLGALRLMLEVLPHPAELRLCDPYRSTRFFDDLTERLRREHHYAGRVQIVRGTDASSAGGVIVGATNVENVIDVALLAPGTLVVDDSWPHCMNGRDALERFSRERDILCTEGGFVRSETAMPRISHRPPVLEAFVSGESWQLFASLNPHDITACVLSALLSARRPELAPTIGPIAPEAARQHWAALRAAGFRAAELNFEGTALAPEHVAKFRRDFGKISPPSAALALQSVP